MQFPFPFPLIYDEYQYSLYHKDNRKFYPTYKGNAKARRAKMKRRRQKRGW